MFPAHFNVGTKEDPIIYKIQDGSAELVEEEPKRFKPVGARDRRYQIKVKNIYTKEQRKEVRTTLVILWLLYLQILNNTISINSEVLYYPEPSLCSILTPHFLVQDIYLAL